MDAFLYFYAHTLPAMKLMNVVNVATALVGLLVPFVRDACSADLHFSTNLAPTKTLQIVLSMTVPKEDAFRRRLGNEGLRYEFLRGQTRAVLIYALRLRPAKRYCCPTGSWRGETFITFI